LAAQREWFDKDYYAVLGVPSSASDKELSRAYKKLAKQHHPDANSGNPAAEERFKEVNAAYEVVGDAEKRKEYDEVRRMVASGVGPGGAGGGYGGGGNGGYGNGVPFDVDFGAGGSAGFTDLLGNLLGNRGRGGRGGRAAPGPQRGQDLETELHLSFDDAVRGVTSTVRFRADASCSTCNGSGAAPGTRPETCPECRGSGSIAVDQGPFSFSQVCPTCGGRGQVVPNPCPTCKGSGVEMRAREVKVRVPAGVTDGQRIRVKGRGGAGANGGPPGDLFVVVGVQSHPLFGRAGNDVTIRLPITVAEATLGADVKVPTLDGQVTMRVPPGTPSGKVMRVRGQGADGEKTENLLVTIEVIVPTELDEHQREAVEALAEAFPDDPRASLYEKQQNRRSSDG
jgi:molecular chaperone DnaJ